MTSSFRYALISLWILIVAVCVSLAWLMHEGYEQSVGHVMEECDNRLSQASGEVEKRFAIYLATYGSQPPQISDVRTRREWSTLLNLVLAGYDGVEGGLWTPQAGFVAYAFPTYQGDLVKKDLPHAETDRIAGLNQESIDSGKPVARHFDGKKQSLFLNSQPLQFGKKKIVIWTMTWSPIAGAGARTTLTYGLLLLLIFALGAGAMILWMLSRFSRSVFQIEHTIMSTPVDELQPLPPSGHRELDRIVRAFNQLQQRLKTSREETTRLSQDLARADRLTMIGRMVSGIAHEIRNPIATIRLRAENALALGDSSALRAILEQIRRLDSLLERLLMLAKLNSIAPQWIRLEPWLKERIHQVDPLASAARVKVTLKVSEQDQAWFDDNSTSRALDNLLLNAVQHTPAGGVVTLSATRQEDACTLTVEDTGPGVPAAERKNIFEPFRTARPDGVGLGLSLVQETAEAHGGHVKCVSGAVGAKFEMELPCPRS